MESGFDCWKSKVSYASLYLFSSCLINSSYLLSYCWIMLRLQQREVVIDSSKASLVLSAMASLSLVHTGRTETPTSYSLLTSFSQLLEVFVVWLNHNYYVQFSALEFIIYQRRCTTQRSKPDPMLWFIYQFISCLASDPNLFARHDSDWLSPTSYWTINLPGMNFYCPRPGGYVGYFTKGKRTWFFVVENSCFQAVTVGNSDDTF